VGTYFWNKHKPSLHTFFSCGSDSLRVPPVEYLKGPMGSLRIHPSAGKQVVTQEEGSREGYMICAILRAMNEAQMSYKERYCRPEDVRGGVRRFTDLPSKALAHDPYA